MNSTVRKSKARKGYELICDAAGKLALFYEYELLPIARAAHPELDDFSPRLVIYDDMSWPVDPDLDGSLHVLASDSGRYEFRMLKALVFFRELYRNENTNRMHHDLRLVFEFKVPINKGFELEVRLDCETGQVWFPRYIAKNRARWCSSDRRVELERYEADVQAKCRKALHELLTKVEFFTVWQHGDTDFAAERVTELLELRRRRGRSHNNSEFVEALATRYYPAGSALPVEQQEPYRQDFLARQEALAA